MKHRWLTAVMPLFAVLFAAACENSGGRVSLSLSSVRPPAGALSAQLVASGPAAAVVQAMAGDSTVIALGADTIILRSVEIVLREIELKRVEAVACDTVVGNDDCEEFETGPVLVSLPLGATASQTEVTINAPAGMYDKLEFKIHKPSSSDDAAFIAANPAFAGVSIRVQGTYSKGGSRSDFVYTTDLDKEQERALVPPITASDGGSVNVTLRLDVSTWFLATGGTALVDPATANKGGQNEGVVKNNIEQSIEAFRDDNHDGHDDDHEGS